MEEQLLSQSGPAAELSLLLTLLKNWQHFESPDTWVTAVFPNMRDYLQNPKRYIKYCFYFLVVGNKRCNNFSFTLRGIPSHTSDTQSPKNEINVAVPLNICSFSLTLWHACILLGHPRYLSFLAPRSNYYCHQYNGSM